LSCEFHALKKGGQIYFWPRKHAITSGERAKKKAIRLLHVPYKRGLKRA